MQRRHIESAGSAFLIFLLHELLSADRGHRYGAWIGKQKRANRIVDTGLQSIIIEREAKIRPKLKGWPPSLPDKELSLILAWPFLVLPANLRLELQSEEDSRFLNSSYSISPEPSSSMS